MGEMTGVASANHLHVYALLGDRVSLAARRLQAATHARE